MGYIEETEINKIRQEADIVDVIGDYLQLQRKGKNYLAVCPFHDDHSPSLVVSPDRQIFNCFTCRTGGNVFSFIMKYENVNFLEAVKIVAEKIGYNLKVNLEKENKASKREYEMYDLAAKYYSNNLNTDKGLEAKKYLLNRGINEDIIKEFKIGLALDSKELNTFLQRKNFSFDEMEKVGLITKSGIDVYDFFSYRIMIPIENMSGEIVAFTGRIYTKSVASKYMNTKETSIYRKSQILFNYHNAKKYIKESKTIIIVEGNMDAIMLSSWGIKNVVALMGVAISNEEIKEIAKTHAKVLLMLDNDKAGLDATIDVGEKLVKNKIEVSVVRLSGAKDPDEYIRSKGIDALKDCLNHAPTYIDFKLKYLSQNKDLNSLNDVVKYIKEVLSSLDEYDNLTKEMVLNNLSKTYNIDKDILKSNLKVKEVKEEKPKVVKKIKTKYEIAKNYILYAMMNDSKYIRIYKEKLGYFKDKTDRIIASEIIYYYNNHNGINIADFTTFIADNKEIWPEVSQIINTINDINMEEFNTCLDVITNELKKDEIKKLKQSLKNEVDINKKLEILNKLAEIKKEV